MPKLSAFDNLAIDLRADHGQRPHKNSAGDLPGPVASSDKDRPPSPAVQGDDRNDIAVMIPRCQGSDWSSKAT